MATRKKAVKKKAPAKKTEKKAGPAPVSRAAAGPALAVTKDPALPSNTDAERTRALNTVMNKLEGKLIPARQMETVYTLRRPTGIVELDVALGGGFPAGGACMISGVYNAGKTWLLFRTMAMQQQIYGNSFMGALHISETQMPYDQMLQAGMRVEVPDNVIRQWIQRDMELGLPMWDNERIAGLKHQIGTLHVIEGGTGEQVLQTVLECVKSNVFNIIGVDSISSLEPQRDADKEMDEDAARAARALMMTKFWPKYVPYVNKGRNTTSLLFTQQVRANDSQYGKEWKVTGGKATEHFKLIDLAMWPGAQIKRQIQGRDYTVGKKTGFETIKGKAGTHDHIKGEFNFYYSEFFPGNVDVHGDLILFAKRQGLLLHTNKGMQLLNGVTREPLDGMYAPTEEAFKECLQVDFDFELDFRRHIMAAAGIKCLYR
jgi:RecA/RadA recombinase